MPLPIGSSQYLGSIDFTAHAFGTLSDLDTPDQVEYVIEGRGSNALLNVQAIQGDKGDPGDNAPLGNRQFPILDSRGDLPLNLTDDPVDVAKYWKIRIYDGDGNEISSEWAMWNGTDYEYYQEGLPGPIGPVPKVSWVFRLDTADTAATWNTVDQGNGYKTTKTGSDASPTVTIDVNRELLRGPAGTGTNWAHYGAGSGLTGTEATNDVPQWDGTKYVPAPLEKITPLPFTFPEGHFTDAALQIGTRVTVGTCLFPPIDHDVIPWVGGHFRVTGIVADTDPFIIGLEVRLGSPTGTLVARGFGNISGYTDLSPHTSTAATPNDAITPTNGRAVIPANSTGAAATLYVNTFNDGASGIYNFYAAGGQVSALLLPV